jgi:transcriptional regulator with XRE-family HTH domain
MSREELADRSGLSAASLRSYEAGRRRPTREHLSHLLECLQLDAGSRAAILTGAGFALDSAVVRFPERNVPPREAMRLVRGRPLPAFLVNARAEILAISAPAWRLLELPDQDLKPSARRSILLAMTRRTIGTWAANWEQLLATVIGLVKAGVPDEQSLDTPGPYLNSILKELVRGDAALMSRFVELWEVTPPFRGRMSGHMYPAVWNTPAGTIRFNCLIGCLNTEVGLYAHLWIPADAKSHLVLETVLAGPPAVQPHRNTNSAMDPVHHRASEKV